MNELLTVFRSFFVSTIDDQSALLKIHVCNAFAFICEGVVFFTLCFSRVSLLNLIFLQNIKSYYKAFSKYSIGKIMVDVAFDILVLL